MERWEEFVVMELVSVGVSEGLSASANIEGAMRTLPTVYPLTIFRDTSMILPEKRSLPGLCSNCESKLATDSCPRFPETYDGFYNIRFCLASHVYCSAKVPG